MTRDCQYFRHQQEQVARRFGFTQFPGRTRTLLKSIIHLSFATPADLQLDLCTHTTEWIARNALVGSWNRHETLAAIECAATRRADRTCPHRDPRFRRDRSSDLR